MHHGILVKPYVELICVQIISNGEISRNCKLIIMKFTSSSVHNFQMN